MQGFRTFGPDATGNFIFPFTLQQLTVLRALAMSQTLEEAAAALSMSEANVRLTLSKLEKDMDVELLQAQVSRPVLSAGLTGGGCPSVQVDMHVDGAAVAAIIDIASALLQHCLQMNRRLLLWVQCGLEEVSHPLGYLVVVL